MDLHLKREERFCPVLPEAVSKKRKNAEGGILGKGGTRYKGLARASYGEKKWENQNRPPNSTT